MSESVSDKGTFRAVWGQLKKKGWTRREGNVRKTKTKEGKEETVLGGKQGRVSQSLKLNRLPSPLSN